MAEVALYDDATQRAHHIWEAHRQLAETLHTTIETVLSSSGVTWADIEAVAVYQGPGSFTGLRIGISVANTIAASLDVPIVGTTGDSWVKDAVANIQAGTNTDVVLPEYGAPVHITQPKK